MSILAQKCWKTTIFSKKYSDMNGESIPNYSKKSIPKKKPNRALNFQNEMKLGNLP